MTRTHTVTALALAALVGGLAACASDTGPTEPVSFARAAKTTTSKTTTTTSPTGTGIKLPKCKPQPYQKTVQTVGPWGGVIAAGKYTLAVPPAALASNVTITMEAMADSTNNVRFSPEGLVFNSTAKPTLTMWWGNCPAPSDPNAVGILYVSDAFSLLEVLSSYTDPWGFTTSAALSHFSRYAVHY
jgi:hypothetical protein